MNKVTYFFGIDISKDVFDVYNEEFGHRQFENKLSGFKSFVKLLPEGSHCVMEATGYYHYLLAKYLLDNSILVSVENPLKIKRFIQMQLTKVKTDKADAQKIYEYALSATLSLWYKPDIESMQMLSLLDIYFKQRTQLKNKLHGETHLGSPSKLVLTSIKRELRNLDKEIENLEIALEERVKEEGSDMLAQIQTIPGVGRKTAVALLVFTNYFRDFDTSSQLCSYAGLTPIIRRSGSSVRGKSRISKVGNAKLRQLLFMCSFNACKSNKACKQLYDRIVAKGKSKKLALIAVCNKLLKQAFAIAKKGLCYDENYRSVLVKN